MLVEWWRTRTCQGEGESRRAETQFRLISGTSSRLVGELGCFSVVGQLLPTGTLDVNEQLVTQGYQVPVGVQFVTLDDLGICK